MNGQYFDPALPRAQGLYDPSKEHDSCGVGFVARLDNVKTNDVVAMGLQILLNIDHRGAVGADPKLGDGCGILTQIPHEFFAPECAKLGFTLPAAQHYGIGQFFMPRDAKTRAEVETIVNRSVEEEGLTLLGWRDVPVDSSDLGDAVKAVEPVMRQVFVGRGPGVTGDDDFERKLYITRKVVSGAVLALATAEAAEFYAVSMSCRTIVYKGMVLVSQLGNYYTDLKDQRYGSALALVHQRFATNTFPSWRLAHPYRMVAHNGEINTLRGNVNWMAARQASVESKLYGNNISKLWPISYEGQSDTACFDNALEFLVQGGYSMAHAAMMLIPEAWSGNPLMSEDRRAFYEYHASLMEPWDGPAAMAFTDGRQIGATLDRNGLRPARYIVTDDGLVVMSSEVGVLPIPEEKIVTKWRLQPGKMLLVDLEKHAIISDDEMKATMASAHPYKTWLDRTQIVLEDLAPMEPRAPRTDVSLLDRQQAFGYTQEDLAILLAPMAITGEEATGSMGTDTPISAMSDQSKLLYTYFKQNFAQVTNPPIDPIREQLVMSLVSFIGPRPNLLDLEGTSKRKRLEVRQPILTNEDLEKIRNIGMIEDTFDTRTLDITYAADRGAEAMEAMLERLCKRAEDAVRGVYNIIILSDRMTGPDRIPIPALLATAAVHHHLIRKGLRTSVGLVVETGEAREVHHFACLAGYGAEAINPYLAFETLAAMAEDFPEEVDEDEVVKRFIKSIGKGLLKVMSKMGISTYQSYCGAQIFDAVGLSQRFVDRYFTGTATRIGGVGLSEISEESVKRHADAFGDSPVYRTMLHVGGDYAFRFRGEAHSWSPQSVSLLQHAVRGNAQEQYRAYAKLLNEQDERLLTIRGLFRVKSAEEDGRKPVPLEEVESAKELVKRFATGAMSYGSISREAHTTLAIAMNRIGGKSNTGEGGEESDRFTPMPNGDSMRSAIKQVASGRFGVTTEYLVNSDMMQIKMAQGAKPGEGGQLPGHKVDAVIAKVRHSTPGVGLISPPPHHDIYSIEDLAQLIYDLKNVNPTAQVSVKLVSEVGVGTVAAGVSKGRADHVTISGYEGGTGASPLTSIKHAGSPWEIGLAETHQTLVLNRLRSRISVQVDGGLRTGRDVIIGALLGADEFGFATAPLVAAGCIMMRKCHLNTCPVGVATQDPVLRKRFVGQPEHVINFFFFVAEEVREIMASLGYRTFNEMIGQMQMLDRSKVDAHWKTKGLDFSLLFHKPVAAPGDGIYKQIEQDHGLAKVLDRRLIAAARGAIDEMKPVVIEETIRNVDRTTGAMLSGEVAKKYGHDGLPDDTIHVKLNGTAGQSFGAWLSRGVTLELEGQANDYVGKGLSGGRVIIYPSAQSTKIVPHESIIVGNTVLYGAIAGECYFRGVAGERFAVRNSGAIAVVEGTGDHGCEYMTGGVVVVIGQTGRNFAAGMSGGIAYVLDEDNNFAKRCNLAMVELESVAEEEELNQRLHHQGGDLQVHGRVDVMNDMTRFDAERLHQLISNHLRYTGSSRAQEILDNWDAYKGKFRKVMPVEYRRALNEMLAQPAAALAAGSNPMGKVTGFLEIDRQDRKYAPASDRIRHYREFVIPLSEETTRDQAARCMNCGIPYCHNGCPVNNQIPDWNDLAYKGEWQEALRNLHSTNNFPEVTGRVCPAPCEESCTLNLESTPVTIKTIECAIVDRGWKEGWIKPEPAQQNTGKKVAVVGSGPAGLAAAQQLARAGHEVHVYEKHAKAGGLLRYGIPDFKMEKHYIDRRVAQMTAEGVTFHYNAHVGVTLPIEELTAQYDAVVLAGGSEKPRDLPIPGRDLGGVHFAMDFLPQQNRRVAHEPPTTNDPIVASGKHVVVIGGGDTGSDCIGTSIRQGALSVTQIEIMPRPPEKENKLLVWPDWPLKLRTSSSQQEGAERDFAVNTIEFTGHGVVKKLRCVRVDPKFQPIAGTEFDLKADLVLLAMGFVSPVHEGMIDSLGVKKDPRGNVAADTLQYKSSVEKVFACGDMRRGQSLVVWAIREGRQCAHSVDKFLMGKTLLPR